MHAEDFPFTPLHDNLVVKQRMTDSVSPGGIHIPDPAREKMSEGEVIASGPGAWSSGTFIPMTVSIGDVIAFTPYAGTSLVLGGQEVLIMKEIAVLGIIKKPKRKRASFVNVADIPEETDNVESTSGS